MSLYPSLVGHSLVDVLQLIRTQNVGPVNHTANNEPWTDAANGDFRVSLSTARIAGRGAFSQTAADYAGSAVSNDIGACRHADPSAADVRYGVQTQNTTGTLEIPNSGTPTGTQDATSDACVVSGKKYGSPQRTGSASAGGGLMVNPGLSGGLR